MNVKSSTRIDSLLHDGELWLAESSQPEATATRTHHSKKCAATTHYFSTGSTEIDESLPGGGLTLHALHELVMHMHYSPPPSGKAVKAFQQQQQTLPNPVRRQPLRPYPPAVVPLILAGNAYHCYPRSAYRCIAWIGKPCWPSAFMLQTLLGSDSNLSLEQCLFLESTSPQALQRSIELCLRSNAVACVVCSPGSLSTSAQRRLAILAKHYQTTVILLATPKPKGISRSFATSQWLLQPSYLSSAPGWQMTLLRNKGGMPQSTQLFPSWIIELQTSLFWSSHEHSNVPANALDALSLRVLSSTLHRENQEPENTSQRREVPERRSPHHEHPFRKRA